jgi:hypothetical protein
MSRHPESTWSRPGVDLESTRSHPGAGVIPESTRSQPGVEPELIRSNLVRIGDKHFFEENHVPPPLSNFHFGKSFKCP